MVRFESYESRRFFLERKKDVSGISGIGRVADGVQWSDGTINLRWNTQHRSYEQFDSINSLVAVHGHEGLTQVQWIDPPPPVHELVWGGSCWVCLCGIILQSNHGRNDPLVPRIAAEMHPHTVTIEINDTEFLHRFEYTEERYWRRKKV